MSEVEKGRKFLLMLGFTTDEALRIRSKAIWQEIERMPEKDLMEMANILLSNFGQSSRELLIRLLDPANWRRIKATRGRFPTLTEIKATLQVFNELISRYGLSNKDIGEVKASVFVEFLAERRYQKAKEIVLERFFGSKITFLSEFGFKKEEVFAIVSTAKGAKWLFDIDKEKLIEMKQVLSQYGLAHMMRPLLITWFAHGKFPQNPPALKDRIKKLFLLGRTYGLTMAKTRRLLTKNPHFICFDPERFGNYLYNRIQNKTFGARFKRKTNMKKRRCGRH
ncbi:MAG: hypothetical protein N3F05_02820 [Candidatus Diapherotrites archaeon]|nr:hypothetical protein [Candidatus Diapherotrites archaeon]